MGHDAVVATGLMRNHYDCAPLEEIAAEMEIKLPFGPLGTLEPMIIIEATLPKHITEAVEKFTHNELSGNDLMVILDRYRVEVTRKTQPIPTL
jgi:hypothetical protein